MSTTPAASSDIDPIQRRLADYALGLSHDDVSPEAKHEAKVRVIDTLGALIAGFHGEAAHVARNLASRACSADGATIVGTDRIVTPDMAAFANAIAARSAEMMDVYHYPGSFGGHPSDVVTPVIAAAECGRVSGRDLILGVAMAYEVFLRFSDVFHNPGFDDTNFACIASSVTAARLWGLTPEQASNAVAMAAVANVTLKQVRTDRLTAWKVVATGHAAKAGLFSAMLAREGLEGPSLPFTGKAGWCDHVARERFSLDVMGGPGVPFKILDTRIKHRPCAGETISSVIAAEKVSRIIGKSLKIQNISVDLYRRAIDRAGSGEHHWSPRSRDAAGNSIPFLVAATLLDGTVTLNTFESGRFRSPDVLELMQQVKLVEDLEFTRAYQRVPVEHRTRVTVTTADGLQIVGETGGDEDDLSMKKTDAQIEAKFRSLAEEHLGKARVDTLLGMLWDLENLPDVSGLPQRFVMGST